MTVGYSLIGSDNDSFFLDDEEKPSDDQCPHCGFLLDFINYFNPFFKIKRKVYDFSSTYDSRNIVSLKFMEFCKREGYKNLIFKSFERDPNFFQILPTEILEFDSDKRGTEFIGYCEVCKNYREVVGAFPAVIKSGSKELKDGFYRSDLLFGARNRKQPIVIVGLETYKKLKREKMKGLIFDPITM